MAGAHARRALAALRRAHPELQASLIESEEQRRVWATGYVDQLLARYRDANRYRDRLPDLGDEPWP